MIWFELSSPGNQSGDDVSDVSIQFAQQLHHWPRQRELLGEMFTASDLLSVLPDQISQLLTPEQQGNKDHQRSPTTYIEWAEPLILSFISA